jgi:hypothetical protein
MSHGSYLAEIGKPQDLSELRKKLRFLAIEAGDGCLDDILEQESLLGR